MSQVVTCPPAGCKTILSSACVFYEGPVLLNTNINTNDSIEVVIQKIDTVVNTSVDDKNFVFTQGLPESTWIIVHTLYKKCSVTVIDTSGTIVVGDVNYVENGLNNTIIITFSSPFAGKAFLN